MKRKRLGSNSWAASFSIPKMNINFGGMLKRCIFTEEMFEVVPEARQGAGTHGPPNKEKRL